MTWTRHAALGLLSCVLLAACGGIASVGAIGGDSGTEASGGGSSGGSGSGSSGGSSSGSSSGGSDGSSMTAECFTDTPRHALATSSWFAAGADPTDYTMIPSASEASVASKTSTLDASTDFGTLMSSTPAAAYAGSQRFSAFVRTTAVTNPSWGALWMRVDDSQGSTLAFDNMQNRPIVSTADVKYEIVLDVAQQAATVNLGVLLAGSGTVIASDAALEPVAADGTYSSNPTVWAVSAPATVQTDSSAGLCGRAVAHVTGTGPSQTFGQVAEAIAADEFRGKRVRMRSPVKTASLQQWVGLFMEVDDVQRTVLASDDMHKRPIQGTTPWQTYDVVLDVPNSAQQIEYGLRITGTGDAWVDVVHFEVVDSSVPTTGQ